MDAARVSVVIPSIGRASVLDAVLVASRSSCVAEIVVVLQGDHPALLSQLAAYPLVRVKSYGERIGLVGARWAGIQCASGRLVLLLDDDIGFAVADVDLLHDCIVSLGCIGVGAFVAGSGGSGAKSRVRRVLFRGVFYDARRHETPPRPLRSRYASGGFFLADREAVVRNYERVVATFGCRKYAWGEDVFLAGFLSEEGLVMLHPDVVVTNREHCFVKDLSRRQQSLERLRRYEVYGRTFAISRQDRFHFFLALLSLLPSTSMGGVKGIRAWLSAVRGIRPHAYRALQHGGQLTKDG